MCQLSQSFEHPESTHIATPVTLAEQEKKSSNGQKPNYLAPCECK